MGRVGNDSDLADHVTVVRAFWDDHFIIVIAAAAGDEGERSGQGEEQEAVGRKHKHPS